MQAVWRIRRVCSLQPGDAMRPCTAHMWAEHIATQADAAPCLHNQLTAMCRQGEALCRTTVHSSAHRRPHAITRHMGHSCAIRPKSHARACTHTPEASTHRRTCSVSTWCVYTAMLSRLAPSIQKLRQTVPKFQGVLTDSVLTAHSIMQTRGFWSKQ